jgi:hypothetical protein
LLTIDFKIIRVKAQMIKSNPRATNQIICKSTSLSRDYITIVLSVNFF